MLLLFSFYLVLLSVLQLFVVTTTTDAYSIIVNQQAAVRPLLSLTSQQQQQQQQQQTFTKRLLLYRQHSGSSSRLYNAADNSNQQNDSSSSAPADDSSNNNKDRSSSSSSSISFDQAGASLIEEEDRKRLEQLGDFDDNPNSTDDTRMEQMRAAIRARTANLGIEKSKVSAEYIAQKQKQAQTAGSARAAAEQSSGDSMFGGLDLSQISSMQDNKKPDQFDENMPTMFYDVDEQLTDEEKLEVDPLSSKSWYEQGLNELQNTQWPSWTAALRELGLIILSVILTGVLVVGWDKVVRYLYTDILHFIPSKEDLENYASRFNELDLPSGWTDNMNEIDISTFKDKISSTTSTIIQETTTTTGIPEL